MAGYAPAVRVLQASVDPDDDSEFRVLVDEKYTKYFTIDDGVYSVDDGVYSVDDMCFAPALVPLLPPFPTGDWNTARISRHPTTANPFFAAVSKVHLPSVTTAWHPDQIDHLELEMGRKLRTGVYVATCARFDSPVVAKFARFAWEVPRLEAETRAYEWIGGNEIGPAFLGHLTEQGRIIGFVMALVVDGREAAPGDLPLCEAVLSRLHRLGIKHGDINKHKFLIHDGKATLIDFDSASRKCDASDLEDEFRRLLDELRDTSGQGGQVVEVNSST